MPPEAAQIYSWAIGVYSIRATPSAEVGCLPRRGQHTAHSKAKFIIIIIIIVSSAF